MKILNTSPRKDLPEVEEPDTRKSKPAPHVETPVPPQVMDPSAPPEIQEKPAKPQPKRKRIPSKKAYIV